MKNFYENAIKCIAIILEKDYHLTPSEAKQAIEHSPLKLVFKKDEEMAAHTSNEAWAKEVFDYWNKNKEN